MSSHSVQVLITPRPGLLDPQGKAVHSSLRSIGFDGLREVRVGRAVRLSIEADSPEAAIAAAEEMSRRLLANPVTEDFTVTLEEETP